MRKDAFVAARGRACAESESGDDTNVGSVVQRAHVTLRFRAVGPCFSGPTAHVTLGNSGDDIQECVEKSYFDLRVFTSLSFRPFAFLAPLPLDLSVRFSTSSTTESGAMSPFLFPVLRTRT